MMSLAKLIMTEMYWTFNLLLSKRRFFPYIEIVINQQEKMYEATFLDTQKTSF